MKTESGSRESVSSIAVDCLVGWLIDLVGKTKKKSRVIRA